MSEKTPGIKDKNTVNEFLKAGYSEDEIEKMSNEEFVYTAVGLVDERSKEEIDEGLGKRR